MQALETPVIAVLMDKDSGQYKGIRLASGQDLFSHQLVLDPTCTVTLAPTSSPPNFLREDLQVLSLKDDKGKDTSIRIIQIRGSLETSVCPKGVYVYAI
ncbi:unnamed protein product [Prunus armeniaca]|uniref:Uncharacterized protein n=1 Tax=Prunus armeniaca TaxID=36596 RepID=A0A6J5WDX8_PRUAR|nr:unnamed protein product [Prunus armeniaca]